MTSNLTLRRVSVWIYILSCSFLISLPTLKSQVTACAPNCQDINVAITGFTPNEFHSKIYWTDFIRNFDCAAPVSYVLQTISGANVARGSSDDAGNEVYIIVNNPCDYLDRELMLTVTNSLGSCMSRVTFHQGMINFTGRAYDVYCDDPRVEAPLSTDIPAPYMACEGLVNPNWAADWPIVKECLAETQDTAKIILREWEYFDKEGTRYSSFDTVIVHRLPILDREHLYCKEQDTLYCGESKLFGPYILVPREPGSPLCDTIPLVKVSRGVEGVTFSALQLDQNCGLQLHLDTTKFTGGCNSMYKLDLEIKQFCGGLQNPAPCMVPMDNQVQQLDQGGAYWRCSFWVVDIDTLAPVARCDYDKYGEEVVILPATDHAGDGHCFMTSERPGSIENAPIIMLSTNTHQCAAVVSIPDLCIGGDWSGIGQVKASISGVGRYVLNEGPICDTGTIYVYEGAVELALSEEPYQILYEVSDGCHNIDSIYCYILVKDATKPTAVAAKGVTVSLGAKTAWVKAETFDEGSYDACQINLLLARRTDWASAGIDLCDRLDTVCVYHDQIVYQPILEEDKDINQIEAHYAKTLQWFEEDGGACANVLLNGWRYGLLEQAYLECTDGHLSKEEFRDLFKSNAGHGCELSMLADGESLGCPMMLDNYDRLLDQAAQMGGGWSQDVPFTCADACQVVTVEILAIDYWCNWSKSWTEVRVEDRNPVTILQELSDQVDITCNTYRNEQYTLAGSNDQLSLSAIVDLAVSGDETAADGLNDIFGGYQKAWVDAYGEYIDAEGNAVVKNVVFHDSVCVCKELVKSINVYDEHLGYIIKDSVYGLCNYVDSMKVFDRGIVGVNCAQNVQCTQTVWTDFDHCGQGYIYRKFKIWHGCPVVDPDFGTHEPDTIERIQKIFVSNSCPLSRAMFDLPHDLEIYSCGIDYDPEGSGRVVGAADPALTGAPDYLFDDDCRIVGVAHDDKVFKIVGGDQACYKILRTWYFADWCDNDGKAEGNWWQDYSLVIDTFVQTIVMIDTVPPVCVITGPVEDGAIIEAAGCYYDFSAELDVMDECGVINYYYHLVEGNSSTIISQGGGDLNTSILDHATIGAAGLGDGDYTLKVRVTDECQNESYCLYHFTVVAGKKPSPVCFTSLTVDLLAEDLNGDGSADTASAVIWASEFDRSSRAPCSEADEDLEFFIEILSPDNPGFESFDPAEDLDFLRLGCEDIGVQTVRMWVLSPTGSIDFCDVVLVVQNNQGGCSEAAPVFVNVSGTIKTIDNQEVEDVSLIATSEKIPVQFDTTGSEGTYDFVFASNDSVKIVPTRDGDDLNGINTADLLALANHTNNSSPITNPYLRIAANVNFDNMISTGDLLILRDVIIGNLPGFEAGNSWQFVPSSYSFTTLVPEGEDFPTSAEMALSDENLISDFVAIKVGDLTLDRNTKKSARSGERLVLYLDDQTLEEGEEIYFSPKFSGTSDLYGMQFELQFDESALEFVGVKEQGQMEVKAADFGIRNVGEGKIYFAWIKPQGAALDGNSALFSLQFRAKRAGLLSDVVAFVADRLQAEAYEESSVVRPMSLAFAGQRPNLEVSQNVPNPFVEQTTIGFTLPEETQVIFLVTDLSGKIVLERNQNYSAGQQSIEIDRNELGPSGVYYYTLKTSYDIQTKKMALLR